MNIVKDFFELFLLLKFIQIQQKEFNIFDENLN
jgi:hypothetical protein